MLSLVSRLLGFSPVERRAAGTSYTTLLAAARADVMTGLRGAAEASAVVQSCISLWENAVSIADVEGTLLLSPDLLALFARSLALRGEFLALLDGDALIPASDWEIATAGGRPRAYRLSLPEAGGGRTLTALAAEVVHVVIGSETREPWIGSAPLRRAGLTADMLSAIERALAEVYTNAPIGSSVLPMPEMARDDASRMEGALRGARGRTLLRESVVVTAAGAAAPSSDWRPHGLTPHLRDAMMVESWDRARDAICTAFGVLPALAASAEPGTGVREAQRHLATWTLQPLCTRLASDMSAKLGSDVTIDVVRPLQAYDAGGRARAFGAVVRGIAEAKAAGFSETEIAAALRLVDWTAPGADRDA